MPPLDLTPACSAVRWDDSFKVLSGNPQPNGQEIGGTSIHGEENNSQSPSLRSGTPHSQPCASLGFWGTRPPSAPGGDLPYLSLLRPTKSKSGCAADWPLEGGVEKAKGDATQRDGDWWAWCSSVSLLLFSTMSRAAESEKGNSGCPARLFWDFDHDVPWAMGQHSGGTRNHVRSRGLLLAVDLKSMVFSRS